MEPAIGVNSDCGQVDRVAASNWEVVAYNLPSNHKPEVKPSWNEAAWKQAHAYVICG